VEFAAMEMRFGEMRALADVDLTVHPGTIHALVGENGAGKSTALGVIAGRLAPSAGSVRVFGENLRPGDLLAARAAGIAAIYQELTVVPELSAEANVFLGQEPSRLGFLRSSEIRSEYERVCERVKVRPVPRGSLAGELSVAEQQVLEILRALVGRHRILLFDEPTAALGISEREALFAMMRSLREEGVTMLFVSHNLDEVLDLSDAISVFRDGRIVAGGERSAFDRPTLVNAMLGDLADSAVLSGETTRTRPPEAAPLVSVRELEVPGAVAGIDLEVSPGEILGLGGLVGSGRTTVLRALAGLESEVGGELELDGRPAAWPRNPRVAQERGIALLPEDRKDQGLVLSMSATDNVLIADLDSVSRHGWLSRRQNRAAAQLLTERFGFPSERLSRPVAEFSGGNQQKLLLARWLHRKPRILLADEPTRGIDIHAKAVVLEALREMAAAGVAVIFVSSEIEEVASIADRVLVLAAGRVVDELDGVDSPITTDGILRAAFEMPSVNP
jgi:ABC-type sugar transport system ATPase subunit